MCVSTIVPSTPPINENEMELLVPQYIRSQQAPSCGLTLSLTRELRKQQDTATSSHDSCSTDTSNGSQIADLLPIKVRRGVVRRPAGYQVYFYKFVIILIFLARISLPNSMG